VDLAHGHWPMAPLRLSNLWRKASAKLAADPEGFRAQSARGLAHQALAVLLHDFGANRRTQDGTGQPAALVINIDMTPAVLPLTADDCTVAFLPSAHIAQRVVAS